MDSCHWVLFGSVRILADFDGFGEEQRFYKLLMGPDVTLFLFLNIKKKIFFFKFCSLYFFFFFM